MYQGRKTIQLNDGNIIPILGYGTAKKPDVAAAITMAITEADMRHLDCAERYNNEVGIGKGLKKLDGDRSELFVTSKRERRGSWAEHTIPLTFWLLSLPVEREPRIALTDTLESVRYRWIGVPFAFLSLIIVLAMTIHPLARTELRRLVPNTQSKRRCRP